MSYKHLTATERFDLHHLLTSTNLSLRAIAKKLKRDASTISRELQRNRAQQDTYLPDTAQTKSEQRRQVAKPAILTIHEDCIAEIKAGLESYHSPEQISGRMKRNGKKTLSHETIYKLIYNDYFGMKRYQNNLRQGKGKRKRRASSKSSRGRIPNRVGIEQRPEIANLKIEIGHWESDTIIGGNHQGVIVTHVDKASKYLMAGLAKSKTAAAINQVTKELFSGLDSDGKKTITSDNGKEFSGHEELANILGVSWYFANPYHSWERGLNEHTNGLIRQYFPKKTNFRVIKPEQLENVVELVNHRPRKSLDYQTPFEVFCLNISETDALQI
jgi:IS30 family transposase